jgi:Ca2+-binding EF-hand superfamily protein
LRYPTDRRAGAACLVAALALAAAGPAAAQRGGGMFQRADQNDDGKVTRQEVIAFAEGRVEMLDNDGDNAFTEKDLRGWVDNQLETATARRFQQRDPNGDGRITKQEFVQNAGNKQQAGRIFKRYDQNGDGVIVPDEMTQVTQKMIKRRRDQQRAQSQQGKDNISRSFASLDSDGDGTVTRQEAVARAKRMFEQRDQNDDGVITRGEGRGQQGSGQ